MSKPLIDGSRWKRAKEEIEEKVGFVHEGLKLLLKDGADPMVIAECGFALSEALKGVRDLDKIAKEYLTDD